MSVVVGGGGDQLGSPIMNDVIMALMGYFGDVIYVQDDEVCIDPCLPFVSQVEREAIASFILPLAWNHWKIRGWVERLDKKGLYLRALSDGIQHLVLDPFAERLLKLEKIAHELPFTDLRFRLSEESFLFPHLWKTLEAIEAEGVWGPHLLSRLDLCSQTGDLNLRHLYEHLHLRARRVFSYQVLLWMTRGKLEDPHSEFFIQPKARSSEDSKGWDGFAVVPSLVPQNIKMSLAEKILFVGKCASLLPATLDRDNSVSEEQVNLSLSDTVDAFGERIQTDVWTKVVVGCQLVDLMKRVKSLLLLGDGLAFHRFAVMTLSLFGSSPTRNAESDLNKHWRECYSGDATFKWDGNYANGWDGVSVALKKLEFPITLVFSPPIMTTYVSIFQVLFKMLRAEVMLSSLWIEVKSMSPKYRIAHRNMQTLIGSLRFFTMVDVIEVGFKDLMNFFSSKSSQSFNDLLAAHQAFVNRVASGVFLSSGSPLRRAVDEIFEAVLQFCYALKRKELDHQVADTLVEFERQRTLFVDILEASVQVTPLYSRLSITLSKTGW